MVISLTDFFDAALRRHNDVILLPAIRRVECLVVTTLCFSRTVYTGKPRRARATGELMRQEMPNFLAPNLWPSNSPCLSPLDYEILAVMQHGVCHRQIHSVDELKRRLISVWCGLGQSIFDEAIDQWRGRHRACVHTKGGHFEYSFWIDNVDFVHICYIQCDLFDGYIFNTKSCQQRWSIHSCSFYKVVH